VRAGVEAGAALTGQALKALIANGIDDKKRIIGTDAPHPFLYNIPVQLIERFRAQLKLVDLQFQGDAGQIQKAVWACYQEEPVDFLGQTLYDPGAYPEPPLSGRITWRVTQPWAEPGSQEERDALTRAKAMIERLRSKPLEKS